MAGADIGLIEVVVFWALGQVALLAMMAVYTKIAGFDVHKEIERDNVAVGVAVGGLLVGIGTRLGNGCTSGHGVCGMTRFSLRSFVSVGVFMAVASVVASLVTPMMGG